jgi:hypothetical protein
MIISYPTALYSSVLPKNPSDSGSVTFMISSEDPPRGSSLAQELFRGEEIRPLPDRVFSYHVRRMTFGDLVFDITFPSIGSSGDGKKPYEVGQVIDFVQESKGRPVLDDLSFPKSLELQQTLNYLDYEGSGLSSEESSLLVSEGSSKYDELLITYRNDVSLLNSKEIQIQSAQKSLNEVKKLKDVASITFGSDDVILVKLEEKEDSLNATINLLINDVNLLIANIRLIYDQIIKLREVIR